VAKVWTLVIVIVIVIVIVGIISLGCTVERGEGDQQDSGGEEPATRGLLQTLGRGGP